MLIHIKYMCIFEKNILIYKHWWKIKAIKSQSINMRISFAYFGKNSSWVCFLLAQCSLGKKIIAARKAELDAYKRSGTSEGTSNRDFTRGKSLLHKNSNM